MMHEPFTPNPAHLAFRVALIVYTGLLAVMGFICLALSDGRFFFTLDDPYIHLSLAENLRRGVYGVNLGEAASASSSILWPLLLLPFPGTLGVPAAFGMNVLGGGLTLLAFARFLENGEDCDFRLQVLILLLLIPGLNLIGLLFTGMEHSLHVALSVWTLLGCMRAANGKNPPPWLWFVLLLGPLVRYEGLAVSLPALAFLTWRGHLRPALLTFGLLCVSLGAFSFFLLRIGLDPLPSSVLVKSDATTGGLSGLAQNLLKNLLDRRGVLMSVGALFCVFHALFSRNSRAVRGLSLAVACMTGMHLAAGRFGWYNRYEIYAWSVMVFMLLRLTLPHMNSWMRQLPVRPREFWILAASLSGLCLFLVPQYWANLVTIHGPPGISIDNMPSCGGSRGKSSVARSP